MQKMILFSCVHTQRLLNEFISRALNLSFKIKRSQMNSKPPKNLTKPYKYPPSLEKEKKVERGQEKMKMKI